MLIIFFVLGYTITLLFTPYLNKIAKHIHLIDVPNSERKTHKASIPLTGGISIAFSLILIITLALGFIENITTSDTTILGIFILFLILGSLDDRFDISAKLKFFIQILCAIVVVKNGVFFPLLDYFFQSYFPLWANELTLVVLIVGTINAYNLTDGIDGLSGGLFLLGFITIAIVSSFKLNLTVAICLVTSGSILAFLKYNIGTKNKVFMGDAGTLSLGFLLVCLYINTMSTIQTETLKINQNQLLITSTLFIPIMDCVLVFLRRINKHQSPFRADRTHLHHLTSVFIKKHQYLSLGILIFAICIMILSLIIYHIWPSHYGLLTIPILYLFLYHLLLKLNKFHEDRKFIKNLEKL